MKRPWAFICASEGATSKHLRNYCREVYLLGYLPVCPKLQDSQYLVLEDAMERSEYTAIVRDMSTAPTMARGFLNIPVPIIPKFRVGHYAIHNTVSMRVLF